MLINNPVITGSFTVNGTNFITNTPTTGSNTFNGNQIISGSAIVTGSLQVTGSMTATGTITAQTLVVQTVTSSVVYSSGSNVFGNSLSNTQKFTGSVLITGSLGINQSAPTYSLDVVGEGKFYQPATSTTAYLRVENNRSRNAAVYTATTNGGFYAGTSIGTDTFNYQIYDGVAGTARLTISSTGAATFSNTLSAAGTISYTGTSNAFSAINGTTGYVYQYFLNTGGSFYLGIERSTGQGLMLNSSAYSTIFTTNNATDLGFGTNGTERMRITSGGNVEIKSAGELRVYRSDNARYGTFYTDNSAVNIATSVDPLQLSSPERITLNTAGTEKMRITTGGEVLIGGTSTTGAALTLYNSTAGGSGIEVRCTATSGNSVVIYSRMSTTGSASNYLFAGQDSVQDKIYIYGTGNVVNRNNSYGLLSDIKLKENITDATPKLEELMQVRIVNYNLIGDELKQIGVIAQELEEVFPGLVDEHPDRDRDGNDLGTTTKSVKMSVFVPMLIKAMQEQQSQIEALKTEIEILKNK